MTEAQERHPRGASWCVWNHCTSSFGREKKEKYLAFPWLAIPRHALACGRTTPWRGIYQGRFSASGRADDTFHRLSFCERNALTAGSSSVRGLRGQSLGAAACGEQLKAILGDWPIARRRIG